MIFPIVVVPIISVVQISGIFPYEVDIHKLIQLVIKILFQQQLWWTIVFFAVYFINGAATLLDFHGKKCWTM